MNIASNVAYDARDQITERPRGTLVGSLFEVIPTGHALGAEIWNVDVRSFDSWSFAALMRALLKHQVLLVRGQMLDEHGLALLRRRLGQASILLSSTATLGAPSSFSSLYAIYDALPPALRRRIAHLEIRHPLPNDVARNADGADQMAIDATVQPLVCIHPDTGRSLLHLGERHSAALLGMTAAQSDALLDELWQFATRPEFAWQCTRRTGDLLIWDPRSTLHRRAPETAAYPQLLRRDQIWSATSPN